MSKEASFYVSFLVSTYKTLFVLLDMQMYLVLNQLSAMMKFLIRKRIFSFEKILVFRDNFRIQIKCAFYLNNPYCLIEMLTTLKDYRYIGSCV